jgi:hypothetical protein
MQHEVGLQIHSFACGKPVAPISFVENAILSLLSDFGTLAKNLLTVNVRFYFWI